MFCRLSTRTDFYMHGQFFNVGRFASIDVMRQYIRRYALPCLLVFLHILVVFIYSLQEG